MISIIPGGDIFSSRCAAIVNAVNCEGVMGKGLAAEFKQRHPSAFLEYQDACRKGLLRPGRCLLSYLDGEKPRFAVQFPTKGRWRRPSRIEYIELGLVDLVEQVRLHAIPSLALPALGCGLGGLSWHVVRPMIEASFAPLDGYVDVELYEPR